MLGLIIEARLGLDIRGQTTEDRGQRSEERLKLLNGEEEFPHFEIRNSQSEIPLGLAQSWVRPPSRRQGLDSLF